MARKVDLNNRGRGILDVLSMMFFGPAEGTVREPFIEPREAIRRNKKAIEGIISKVPSPPQGRSR